LAELTQARLKELINYDPTTGIFTWRVTRGRVNRGEAAGCKQGNDQYMHCCIRIDSVNYKAHRLAFLYMHSYMPPLIDHKDGDTLNNRIENLRQATQSQNLANCKCSKNNASGFKSVWFHKGDKRWMSQIMARGHKIYLGSFLTPEEAHEAYKRAALTYFGEFARFE